tara:strand:+ start:74 stop:496 length:423 start_codon:yes stop_codon:yes gene_type:complete
MAQMNVTPNKGKNVARKWYTDLDINLTAHPQSGDLVLKQDKEAIKRSLRNILLTNHYERPFKPSFGANLIGELFEPNDAITIKSITKEIKSTIQELEPRIKIYDIFYADQDDNALNLTIHYGVTGSPEPQELTVLLKRVR